MDTPIKSDISEKIAGTYRKEVSVWQKLCISTEGFHMICPRRDTPGEVEDDHSSSMISSGAPANLTSAKASMKWSFPGRTRV